MTIVDLRNDTMKRSDLRRIELDEGNGRPLALVWLPPDLVVDPSLPWVEHICKDGLDRTILNTVVLHPTHNVIDNADGVTVSPSISCPCGLHGFVRGSVWTTAGSVRPPLDDNHYERNEDEDE